MKGWKVSSLLEVIGISRLRRLQNDMRVMAMIFIAALITFIAIFIYCDDSIYGTRSSPSLTILASISAVTGIGIASGFNLLTLLLESLGRWRHRRPPPPQFMWSVKSSPTPPRWPPMEGKKCGIPLLPRKPAPFAAHATAPRNFDRNR